jgi:predicted dehydrogenase
MPVKGPIRLGIIGCGIAARELHWPALQRLPDHFTIVAVCNHTPEKAMQFAEMVGIAYGKDIPYVLDYQQLLSMPEVEAVAILLPVELNKRVCQEAAAAGKHILVEKPISENLESASRLLKLEREYPQLAMMVAENFRYRPIYTALAEVLRSGTIGTPYFAEWRCWQRVDPATNKYAGTRWRINHQYAGGFVTDAGVHNIAVLRDMLGRLELVGSTTCSVNPAIGRTDTLVYLFRSEGCDGIPPLSGILNMGFSVNGITDFRLQVLGSQGSAIVDGTTLSVYGQTPNDEAALSVQEYPDDGGYYAEYLDFHKAITTGQPPISTFEKAYGDLETILNAIEGAKGSETQLADGF